ncbi:hypothetical protein BGP_4612 [Beggiatoa sp. PS]|nr:hypothetical protein BGP_4612 [Beggiatoa sp. PS]
MFNHKIKIQNQKREKGTSDDTNRKIGESPIKVNKVSKNKLLRKTFWLNLLSIKVNIIKNKSMDIPDSKAAASAGKGLKNMKRLIKNGYAGGQRGLTEKSRA